MDPNANLAEQERILADPTPDRVRLRELRDALDTWLFHGGFAPTWSLYPRAAAHYTAAPRKD